MPYTTKRRIATALCLLLLATSTPAIAPAQGNAIAQGQFTVEPGHHRYFTFEVYQRARVYGRFRAQGGSRNDIEVYLLDADGYENFRNGHRAPTYYNSGRVTVGSINVNLGQGQYVLVFNNGFSAFANKVVTADIRLQ